jgi:hypothetical protein
VCGSSGKALSQQAQGLKFEPQYWKTKQNKTKNPEEKLVPFLCHSLMSNSWSRGVLCSGLLFLRNDSDEAPPGELFQVSKLITNVD